MKKFILPTSAAVLGYGVEGKALVSFLLKQGLKELCVFDERMSEESVAELEKLGVEWKKGLSGLERFEVCYRSPAILPTRAELKNARKISSATELFLELCETENIIGVTGTKGKGTTTTLIAEVLKASGRQVWVGGNIGKVPLDFVDEIKKEDWVVLELSSFQTMDLEHPLKISVVLMVTSEHLDVHKNTAEYRAAKGRLASIAEVCIYNKEYEGSREVAEFARGKKIGFTGSDVREKFVDLVPGLLGEHNTENIAATGAPMDELMIAREVQKKVFESFTGLPNRLEQVREIAGVKFINDSFSTTPETAIAALNSFPNKRVLWLAGGSSKGSDFSSLQSVTPAYAILFGVEGKRVAENLRGVEYVNLGEVDRVRVEEEIKKVWKNFEVVLLSPACASFGMFENYKERGEWFRSFARKLSEDKGVGEK